MKLHRDDREVLRSKPIESHSIAVKSPTVLFEILCNKTYQYPLPTMVQEYMSNARDAHREIGRNNVPIKVVIPTDADPKLTIRDFGPGISPSRMSEVFVFLGESTKRDSDDQHGGFGIGAKVGFAYVDSFVITSRVAGITREYMAYKGEDHIGHIDLVGEYASPADEPDGVSVSIPIRPSDFWEVQRAVVKCAFFWRTPPEVHNLYDKFGALLTGWENLPDSQMTTIPPAQANDLYSDVLYKTKTPLVVMDRIIYGILPEIKGINSSVIRSNSAIFLNTGQVDVAVNREGLQYSQRTIQTLQDIISENSRNGINTARSEFIQACDLDLMDTADNLRSLVSSVVTKTCIMVNWGSFDLVYQPGADEPLCIEVPHQWEVYEVHMDEWTTDVRADRISRLKDSRGSRGAYRGSRTLLPLDKEYRYVLDDRDTIRPSVIMINRWYQEGKEARRHFVLRHKAREADEWIFPITKEIDLTLLSRYVKKPARKGGSSKGPRMQFRMFRPHGLSMPLDNDKALGWLDESDSHIMVVALKKSADQVRSDNNEFNHALDMARKFGDMPSYGGCCFRLISNVRWLVKLASENEQIVHLDEWVRRWGYIQRNLAYQSHMDAVGIMWRLESILLEIRMDWPERIKWDYTPSWRSSSKLQSWDDLFMGLSKQAEEIKDPFISKLIEFCSTAEELSRVKGGSQLSARPKWNRMAQKRLPDSWGVQTDYDRSGRSLVWDMSDYPLLVCLANSVGNGTIRSVMPDIVKNYLREGR